MACARNHAECVRAVLAKVPDAFAFEKNQDGQSCVDVAAQAGHSDVCPSAFICVCASVCWVCACMRACGRTCVRACVRACVGCVACVRACVRTRVRACECDRGGGAAGGDAPDGRACNNIYVICVNVRGAVVREVRLTAAWLCDVRGGMRGTRRGSLNECGSLEREKKIRIKIQRPYQRKISLSLLRRGYPAAGQTFVQALRPSCPSSSRLVRRSS